MLTFEKSSVCMLEVLDVREHAFDNVLSNLISDVVYG